MKTQPPFSFSDGVNPRQPVARTAWSRFCSEAAAQQMLARVQDLAPNAVLQNSTASEPGYTAMGENPDNVQVWIISGTMGSDQNEVCEWAGSLIDRRTAPQIFIDQYPAQTLHPNLCWSASYGVAELFWSSTTPAAVY